MKTRILSILFLVLSINIAFGTTSKVISCMADIHQISIALELYKMDNGQFPSSDNWQQDIKKYIDEEDYTDPWGNQYIYLYPGTHNRESFDIYSFGKDGFSETGGNDKDDINNWDAEHTWLYKAYGLATQHQLISIQIGILTLGILIISVIIYGVYLLCKKHKKGLTK